MNRDNIKSVENILSEIEAINVAERIATQYKDKELEAIVWHETTALEFPGLVSRVVGQLRAEIEGDRLRFYPAIFPSETPQYQNKTLVSALQQFVNLLRNGSWPDAAVWLKVLIDYQVFCGFWDRGPKQYSFTRLRREAVLREFEARQQQALATVAEARKVLSELRETVGSIKGSKDEVSEVTGKVRKNAEEVTEILGRVAASEGKLDEILKAQDNHKRVTEQFLLRIDARNGEFEKAATEANERLEKSKEVLGWIQEKEGLVNRVAGTAAAGLLGQKFEARRNELGKVCNWWLGGLVVALAVAGAWLWVTHKYFHLDGVIFWAQIASNFGLMLPALFLVLFVAAQYLKERNFQEEYAFRAAVAMTMKAFADEMNSGNAERSQVLKDALGKLYQLPNGLVAKDDGNPASVSKAVTEFLKGTTELVKEVKK